MKHFRATTILVGGLAVVALLAGNALATTAVFSGRYAGTTTEMVNGQKITAVAKGKGTATLIGKSTIRGTVIATSRSQAPSRCEAEPRNSGRHAARSGSPATTTVRVAPSA